MVVAQMDTVRTADAGIGSMCAPGLRRRSWTNFHHGLRASHSERIASKANRTAGTTETGREKRIGGWLLLLSRRQDTESWLIRKTPSEALVF